MMYHRTLISNKVYTDTHSSIIQNNYAERAKPEEEEGEEEEGEKKEKKEKGEI